MIKQATGAEHALHKRETGLHLLRLEAIRIEREQLKDLDEESATNVDNRATGQTNAVKQTVQRVAARGTPLKGGGKQKEKIL